MFDSIGIIKLDTSQNRALAGVGKATRKKMLGAFKGGRYNESLVQKNKEYGIGLDDDDDHDNNLRRRSLLGDMKEYVLDLIPMTEVLNLLIRFYSNFSGPARPGEGGDGGGEIRRISQEGPLPDQGYGIDKGPGRGQGDRGGS